MSNFPVFVGPIKFILNLYHSPYPLGLAYMAYTYSKFHSQQKFLLNLSFRFCNPQLKGTSAGRNVTLSFFPDLAETRLDHPDSRMISS